MEDNILDDLIIFESELDKEIDPVSGAVIEEELEDTELDPPTDDSDVDNLDDPSSPPVSSPKQPATASTEDNSDDDVDYTPYYEFLVEAGGLAVGDDFEFDGSKESFEKALELDRANVYNTALTSIWSHLPSDFKPLLEYGLKGGTSVKEYLDAYSNDYSAYKVDTSEDQRKVVFDYYKMTTNRSDERINKLIDKLEDQDELVEEAQEALEQLREIQEEKKQELLVKAEQEAENRRKASEQLAASIVTAIDNVTTDTTRKNKLKALFFNEMEFDGRKGSELDYKIQSVKRNPEHLAQLGDLFLEYSVEKGFNFDRFLKQGRTQANKGFQKLLEQRTDPASRIKGGNKPSSKDDFNLGKWIDN